MTRPVVAVGSLGGTIAMAPLGDDEGASPALDSADLVAAVPTLADIADIRAASICNVSSSSITFGNLLEALKWANEMVEGGAAGVVLTHGTDTLEESAYFLDLLWARSEPLILTGAMRSSQMPGADGPANLLAAVITASEPQLRDFGVLVVFDDEVHLARTVTKSHANAVWTFKSRDWGPVARVVEQNVRVMMRPAFRPPALTTPTSVHPRIPILEMGLQDDGKYLTACLDVGADAVVIAAAGVGHVPVPLRDAAVGAVQVGVPVVLATRHGSGTTGTKSYAYPGSEVDCLARGMIGAGYLSPRKARILLAVLCANGASVGEIKAQVELRGD